MLASLPASLCTVDGMDCGVGNACLYADPRFHCRRAGSGHCCRLVTA